MDLIIVPFYAFCGNLLIQSGHQDHPKAKMPAAEKDANCISQPTNRNYFRITMRRVSENASALSV